MESAYIVLIVVIIITIIIILYFSNFKSGSQNKQPQLQLGNNNIDPNFNIDGLSTKITMTLNIDGTGKFKLNITSSDNSALTGKVNFILQSGNNTCPSALNGIEAKLISFTVANSLITFTVYTTHISNTSTIVLDITTITNGSVTNGKGVSYKAKDILSVSESTLGGNHIETLSFNDDKNNEIDFTEKTLVKK